MRPTFDEMYADGSTVREHYRGYDRWRRNNLVTRCCRAAKRRK